MPKYTFIVNPISGRGAGYRSIPTIESFIKLHALDAKIITTDYAGHAIRLAQEHAPKSEIIVAVGGDGTSNEIINGLMQIIASLPHQPAMGVISIGRGNDFAYGAGIPIGLENRLRALLESQLHVIDIGFIKGGDYPAGRYFGNGVGIGFDAVVGFVAAKSKLTGFLSYIVAALKTIFVYYSAPLVKLDLNQQTFTLPALMVSVMNGRRMGGGFYMAPQASNQDGLLDICIANEVSKGRILTLIPHFLRGSQFSQAEIQFFRSSTLHVEAIKGTLPIHADGETICVSGQEVTIELLPKALNLWKPPH
jgi:YegS/Rv2252/BmrU family lipid kinase